MEDRFKFRAWHKRFACLERVWGFTPETITFVNDMGETIAWFLDEVILMQCTGTSDRNGKLIYEGDILVQEYLESIYVIQFCGTCFMAVLHTKAPQMDCLIEGSTYEVVGNIWENKELLEAHDK